MRALNVNNDWTHLVDKRKILIQLDSDAHASVFDRVVAVDAGAEEIFSYANVKPEHVQGMVHGAIFTRGPKDLARTAFLSQQTDEKVGPEIVFGFRSASVGVVLMHEKQRSHHG